MSIERIMAVNLIGGFPHELTNMIKDYCFYDKKTWSTISHNRKLKKLLLNSLNSLAVISNPTIGYWSLLHINHIIPSTILLQGVNCFSCGDFKGDRFVGNTPALCMCNNPPYIIDEGEYYEDEDEVVYYEDEDQDEDDYDYDYDYDDYHDY